MKTLLFSALFVCTAVQTAFTQDNKPQTIKTDDGFSIQIPGDWKEIPKKVLDAYSDAVVKAAPQSERQVFDYGFQRSTAQNWFSCPYILIQVKHVGRVPEAQLKAVKQVQRGISQGLEELKDKLSTIASDMQVGETRYDPSTHILWSQLEMNVTNVGKIKGIVAVMLTENGYVQIAGYEHAQDFANYVPQFESIVKNTVLDDNLKYKPRVTDALPGAGKINWPEVLGQAVGYALVGGVVGAVVWATKRKK